MRAHWIKWLTSCGYTGNLSNPWGARQSLEKGFASTSAVGWALERGLKRRRSAWSHFMDWPESSQTALIGRKMTERR